LTWIKAFTTVQIHKLVTEGKSHVIAVAVVLRELTRYFGAVSAVDKVSFSVFAGEAFGLTGANSAGKSTIVKMLTTLLPPSARVRNRSGL